MSSSSSPTPSRPLSLDESIRWILSKNFDADSKVCCLTLLKIIDNVLQNPGNDKVRSLRVGNATIRSKILDRHGRHVLSACGFVREPADPKRRTEERLVLQESNEDTETLVEARHALARVVTVELGLQAGDLPPYKAPPAVVRRGSGGGGGDNNSRFDVYAGRRFDGQSAAVGTNLGAPDDWTSQTERDLSKLKQREAKLRSSASSKPIDRRWTVSLPGRSRSPASSFPQQPSASSSATRGDASLLASHAKKQHAKRVASENRGFTTRAMRDLEKLRAAKVYSHTQLAIHFPDGVSVKANFSTTERIRDVLRGLSERVLFSTATLPLPDLELYRTPPRRVLGADKTLHDLGLVPAAKVYASWKTKLPNIGDLGAGWYVRPELSNGNASSSSSSSSYATPNPVLPTSVPVARLVAASAAGAVPGSGGGVAAPKKKKTKAEKEAALMKRMLGK